MVMKKFPNIRTRLNESKIAKSTWLCWHIPCMSENPLRKLSRTKEMEKAAGDLIITRVGAEQLGWGIMLQLWYNYILHTDTESDDGSWSHDMGSWGSTTWMFHTLTPGICNIVDIQNKLLRNFFYGFISYNLIRFENLLTICLNSYFFVSFFACVRSKLSYEIILNTSYKMNV